MEKLKQMLLDHKKKILWGVVSLAAIVGLYKLFNYFKNKK